MKFVETSGLDLVLVCISLERNTVSGQNEELI